MGVRIENHCCDCKGAGLPCRPNCTRKHVEVWFCDECDDTNVDLYDVDGRELCADCALRSLYMIHRE